LIEGALALKHLGSLCDRESEICFSGRFSGFSFRGVGRISNFTSGVEMEISSVDSKAVFVIPLGFGHAVFESIMLEEIPPSERCTVPVSSLSATAFRIALLSKDASSTIGTICLIELEGFSTPTVALA